MDLTILHNQWVFHTNCLILQSFDENLLILKMLQVMETLVAYGFYFKDEAVHQTAEVLINILG